MTKGKIHLHEISMQKSAIMRMNNGFNLNMSEDVINDRQFM